MGKILLFYKYTHFEHPKRIMKWQKKICADLNLTGRILIAKEGINGTVGGSIADTERYKQIMLKHAQFADMDIKESKGDADCFPKMYIAVKPEVVHLGLDPEKTTPEGGGIHLKPKETHKLITSKPDDLVILDARNNYEWKIGHFKDAILPDIGNFREFPEYVDQNLNKFKDKQVLMYCTGGIRCERASTYLRSKGVAKEVYQMEGGIHRYAEQYPDGFFRGKNYVFDGRVGVRINDDVLGTCELCNTTCDDYTNCKNALCNKHFVCCAECIKKFDNACSTKCQTLLLEHKVEARP